MNIVPLVDGNDLPCIGLGSFRMETANTKECVSTCLNASIRHFCISELFGNGHEVVDSIIEHRLERASVYITMKIWPKDRNGKEIVYSIRETLRLSGLEYVDLLLLHAPIDIKNRFEQWEAMEYLKNEGSTRSIGVANYSEQQLLELVKNCQIQPSVLAMEVTPFGRNLELVEFCSDSSIAVLCDNLQGKGVREGNKELLIISEELGIPIAQVILKWVIGKGLAVLLSPAEVKQLNLAALESSYEELNGDYIHHQGESATGSYTGEVGSILEEMLRPMSKEYIARLDSLDENLCTAWRPVEAAQDDA